MNKLYLLEIILGAAVKVCLDEKLIRSFNKYFCNGQNNSKEKPELLKENKN
jgi:hypothetical protein